MGVACFGWGWRFDCVGYAFEGFQGLVYGGGYCGGQVAAYSFCCQELVYFGEGFWGGLHYVVVGAAVGVDVEEGGG